jgi:hypothetical protein
VTALLAAGALMAAAPVATAIAKPHHSTKSKSHHKSNKHKKHRKVSSSY